MKLISRVAASLLNAIRVPSYCVHGDEVPAVDGSGNVNFVNPVIKVINTTGTDTVLDLIPADQERAVKEGLATTKNFVYTIPANSEKVVPQFLTIIDATSSNYRVAGVYFEYSSN